MQLLANMITILSLLFFVFVVGLMTASKYLDNATVRDYYRKIFCDFLPPG